jgi:hypothetical protein
VTTETTSTESTETASTDIATLPPAERALIVLESTKTEEHLIALVVEAQPITVVNSPAGREQAHKLGMKLKNARVTIEKTGKAAREDAQAFSRAVIDEEKRLKGIIAAEETRIFALRDGYDAEVEAKKAAEAAAEAARIAAIKEKIDGVRNLPLSLAGETSEVIEAEMVALAAFTPSEEAFQEFTDECKTALSECILALDDLLQRVKVQERAAAAAAEAQRIAEETLAAERAAIAAERAAIDAERAALAAERAALDAAKLVDTTTSTVTVVESVAGQTVPTLSVESAPAATETVAEPEFTIHDKADELPVQMVGAEPATDWKIRQFALATADQFTALAGKVALCGELAFSTQLFEAAIAVREGQFDAAMAGANTETLVKFDNDLIDATVNAIDALGGGEVQAAA